MRYNKSSIWGLLLAFIQSSHLVANALPNSVPDPICDKALGSPLSPTDCSNAIQEVIDRRDARRTHEGDPRIFFASHNTAHGNPENPDSFVYVIKGHCVIMLKPIAETGVFDGPTRGSHSSTNAPRTIVPTTWGDIVGGLQRIYNACLHDSGHFLTGGRLAQNGLEIIIKHRYYELPEPPLSRPDSGTQSDGFVLISKPNRGSR